MTPQDQAKILELQRRLEIRGSFRKWCCENLPEDQVPAKHHDLIMETLQKLVKNQLLLPSGIIAKRLIIMLPPGAAKSTYTSWLFPGWFLNIKKGLTILAASYAYDLAESFGRRCRNTIDNFGHLLGYQLKQDSKAAGEWETTNDGRYFCAGVNAGIAGHRADLGLIDDPIGDEKQANSKLFRDRLWDWYRNDFVPRLKPQAWRVIICNRRHEDDLVGRLTNPKFPENEAEDWYVLSLPMEAEANDPLGRQPGERLWSEWFTEKQVADAKKNPRTWSGLYQQHPTPESGDFFQRSWVDGGLYMSLSDLPKDLTIYSASDHSCSTSKGANKNCFGSFGVDGDYHIWILPDLFWQSCSPGDAVEAMFDIVRRRRPVNWTAERGHISLSLRPLIEKLMVEKGLFFVIDEKMAPGNKRMKCGAIAGMMQMHRVHFPCFAPWWSDALFEMMSFTGEGDDESDDFCDFLGLIGMKVNTIMRPSSPLKEHTIEDEAIKPFVPTMGWLKEQGLLNEKPVWRDM